MNKLNYARSLLFVCIGLTGCTLDTAPLGPQRAENIEEDLMSIYAQAPSPPLKLSLQEIIAIAIENNYDLQSKAVEYEVQHQFAIRDQLKMLPQLLANGEISERNNELIVSSTSVDPTVPPAPPSISTQRHVNRHDITAVFNLLDFGLSYFKARQEEKKAFIMALEYEKNKQALILDIHKQYWKAVASKFAMEASAPLLTKAQDLQQKIGLQISDRLVSTTKGFKSSSDLQVLQVQWTGFDNDYYKAMSELAVFMGLPPNTCFELDYNDARPQPCELEDICSLEQMALMQRPELYIKDEEEKISEDEVRYALLQMLPGVELFAGNYYDANKYFTFHNWVVAGARATWNLLAFPNQAFDVKGHRKRTDLVKTQRMALSVGVLSQVRLAYILYQENYSQYQLVHSLETTQQGLLKASREDTQVGATSPYDLIMITSQAMLAKTNAIKAYGELQIALAQLKYSTGSSEEYFGYCLLGANRS